MSSTSSFMSYNHHHHHHNRHHTMEGQNSTFFKRKKSCKLQTHSPGVQCINFVVTRTSEKCTHNNHRHKVSFQFIHTVQTLARYLTISSDLLPHQASCTGLPGDPSAPTLAVQVENSPWNQTLLAC